MTLKHAHIIIVGAGITGASLAYHLAKQNVRVTLIDKATKPASDVSGKSFGWINGGYDAFENYLHLRQQAIADWHRVEDELKGQLKINWPGALSWYKDAAETERIAHHLINTGYPVQMVNKKEIFQLEPNLRIAPVQAMFAKHEGSIDAAHATELFIKAAAEAGANIQLGNEVLSFTVDGSNIEGVVTVNGKLKADEVIIAAGTNAVALCESLNITLPVNISPAVLMSFHNHQKFVNKIISNPFMEIRSASNTVTLAAENYIDESKENNPTAIAQRILEEIKKHWQGIEQIKLINVMVGRRAIPQDDLPVIGRISRFKNLYVSVMHAGVTLAAITGRLAADEILNHTDNTLLSPYRIERFGASIKC